MVAVHGLTESSMKSAAAEAKTVVANGQAKADALAAEASKLISAARDEAAAAGRAVDASTSEITRLNTRAAEAAKEREKAFLLDFSKKGKLKEEIASLQKDAKAEAKVLEKAEKAAEAAAKALEKADREAKKLTAEADKVTQQARKESDQLTAAAEAKRARLLR